MLPLILTVAPRLKCPLKKRPILPIMIMGMKYLTRQGTSWLKRRGFILLFKSLCLFLSSCSIRLRSSTWLVFNVSIQLRWRRLLTKVVITNMEAEIMAIAATTTRIAIKNSIEDSSFASIGGSSSYFKPANCCSYIGEWGHWYPASFNILSIVVCMYSPPSKVVP